MTSRHTNSHAVDEYLEAIHRFGDETPGISTGRLAEHLGVRPSSVTGMLRRLAELGLISYRRYGEIALTGDGQRQAHALVKRHRLAERLLADLLNMPLDQVHDQACHLEHGVSPEIEARLEAALGAPVACPHGHPIDPRRRERTLPLSLAPLGREMVVVRLEDESQPVVEYLSRRRLLPGARVTPRKWESLGEVLVLESAGATHTLSASLAKTVRVKR